MAGQRFEPFDVKFDDDAYIAKLDAKLKRLGKGSEADVKATGVFIVSKAKGFAAVDTGFMRANITYEERTDSQGFYIAILCRADYWKHVEFGTSTQSAQPFQRPAFVLGKQYLIDRIKKRA